MSKRAYGFTIVELLIVIVVIAILASVSILAYTGIQSRARDTARQSDINQVYKLIELYRAEHGTYPATATVSEMGTGSTGTVGNATMVRTDANCAVGTRSADWVPGLTSLPQSIPNTGKGARGETGCYMYVSEDQRYILSAWNNLEGGPQTSTMYRRLGFREMSFVSSNFWMCNHQAAIGGYIGGSYTLDRDYYKRSYTISNIATCNETPPPGA